MWFADRHCPKGCLVADRVSVKDKVGTVSKAVRAFDRVSANADERRSKFHLRPVGRLSGRFRFSRWGVALDWLDLHLIHKNMAVATSSSAMLGAIFA